MCGEEYDQCFLNHETQSYSERVMIFFCEECGEKNDLENMPRLDGKVVFQCRGCGYKNAYSVCLPGAGPNCRTILKKICSFSQVIGLFLYHTQNGLMENQMPAILSRTDVETLGRNFTHVHGEGRSLYPDIKGMSALIGDKYFTVHMVEPLLFVVIVAKESCLPNEICRLVGLLNDSSHRQ